MRDGILCRIAKCFQYALFGVEHPKIDAQRKTIAYLRKELKDERAKIGEISVTLKRSLERLQSGIIDRDIWFEIEGFRSALVMAETLERMSEREEC